jgi:hypothetical protein
VPRVVSEQLGLQKGFGLVVDYVVPEGPAAAAGVQQNDIIKMFNDQILMDPDQLSKLVRSYQDGTNVTLTILRKNAETKVTVKLGKKEVRQHERDYGMFNMEDMNEKMQAMNEKMKDFKFDFNETNFDPAIRETVRNAQREAARVSAEARAAARAEAQRARDEAQRTRDQAQRARDEARRSREMRLFSNDKGTMKSTTIDLGKATIVFTDDKGEMKIETVGGKKILTAKDPQGRLLFSGPVDSKEDLDKAPPEVRERYNKLEVQDLPGVGPNTFVEKNDNADNDNDNNNDEDTDNDSDSSNDDETSVDVSRPTMQGVSFHSCPSTVRNWNIVSI